MAIKDNPKGETAADNFNQRATEIEGAIDRVFEAIVGNDDNGEIAPLAGGVLMLVGSGLLSLVAIANAQQRLAAIAEADLSALVEQAIKDREAELKEKIKQEQTKRNFIGKGD